MATATISPRRHHPSSLRRSPLTRYGNTESDLIVEVEGEGFALHKFVLSSRSGHIKKLVALHQGPDACRAVLANVPGGADAFELAAKFCYGIRIEINTLNVAALRSVGEYLEMTEEYGEENLISSTELFLKEVVLHSFEKSIKVLQSCENFLAVADSVNLTRRCINTIASEICGMLPTANMFQQENLGNSPGDKMTTEWWVDDVCSLQINIFRKLIVTLKARRLELSKIAGILMHYVHRTLKITHDWSYMISQEGGEHGGTNLSRQHDQRIVVETIANLLPAERDIVPIKFLFVMLRAAIVLDSTIACRLELEKRIGSQLEQASVEDLLIPYISHKEDTIFDIGIVSRLLVLFLQHCTDDSLPEHHSVHEQCELSSTAIREVANLIDEYLAEIAPDANLTVSKFMSIAELLPVYAHVVDDGIYRAIDIYLKAHPNTSDIERKKLCKLMNCQKLSHDASTHAAQNERLPVYFMMQVLYFEQLKLRSIFSEIFMGSESLQPPYISQQASIGVGSATMSPKEDFASLKRENELLRLEVLSMRSRLNDLEKDSGTPMAGKPSSSKRFLTSISRSLSKVIQFVIHDRQKEQAQAHSPYIPRRRRHSLS